jgi:uncharacterized membrane protein
MDEETRISKSRLEALTDGIFAIVMTLLILEIAVPQISSHEPHVVAVELFKRFVAKNIQLCY